MTDFVVPEYAVYLDTNPLFSRKPEEVIARSAISSLANCRKLAVVKAFVPQVVADELSFQQYKHALAASENLRKNLATLEGSVGAKYPPPPSPPELAHLAKESIEKALKASGIDTIQTPIAEIDWQQVVNDSCWRGCVFEPPPEDQPQFEKGFRDRMVLETIIASSPKHSERNELIFITNDARTATSARERAKIAGLKLTVHNRISELESEINLTKQTKSEGYAKAIFEQIDSVFYKSDDPECLFYRFSIKEKALEEFGASARNKALLSILGAQKSSASPSSNLYQSLAGLAGPSSRLQTIDNWDCYSGLRLQIGSTEFCPADDYLFHWKTRIEILSLFQKRNSAYMPTLIASPKDLILVTKVDVFWSCEVCPKTAKITNAQLDEIKSGGLSTVRDGDVFSRMKYSWPIFRNRSAEEDDSDSKAMDLVIGEDPEN